MISSLRYFPRLSRLLLPVVVVVEKNKIGARAKNTVCVYTYVGCYVQAASTSWLPSSFTSSAQEPHGVQLPPLPARPSLYPTAARCQTWSSPQSWSSTLLPLLPLLVVDVAAAAVAIFLHPHTRARAGAHNIYIACIIMS